MRSVDLLGVEAVDRAGRVVGTVHDIRLGSGATPTQDSGEPAFAIRALVIGSAGYAHRLGYGRGEMAGPWPLTLFFRRMARRSIVVPWSDVERIDDGRVTVHVADREHTAGDEAT